MRSEEKTKKIQNFANTPYYLTCINKSGCLRTQDTKKLAHFKKSPYLCTVERNKRDFDKG